MGRLEYGTYVRYVGDVLNFGMAAEKAKAAGIKVDMVSGDSSISFNITGLTDEMAMTGRHWG